VLACWVQHTATRCNTMQHTSTQCNTLQRNAAHCSTLQHAATLIHYNTLQHTATNCTMLQHVYMLGVSAGDCAGILGATHRNTMQHTAAHCKTLQHTATRYNTCTCWERARGIVLVFWVRRVRENTESDSKLRVECGVLIVEVP